MTDKLKRVLEKMANETALGNQREAERQAEIRKEEQRQKQAQAQERTREALISTLNGTASANVLPTSTMGMLQKAERAKSALTPQQREAASLRESENELRLETARQNIARRSRGYSMEDEEAFQERTAPLRQQIQTARSGDKPGFGEWLGQNAGAGLSQVNQGLFSTLDFLLPSELFYGDEYADPISQLNRYYTEQRDAWGNQAAQVNEEKGGAYQAAGQLVQGVAGAAPNAILAAMSGGTSAAVQGAAALSGAASSAATGLSGLGSTITTVGQTLAKNPTFWTSVLQTVGPAYDDAKAEGASELEATASALITGFLNSGVEVSGGIEALPSNLAQGGESAIRQWVKSMLDEGKEEVVQGVIQSLSEKAVYDQNRPWISTEDQNAVINPLRMGQEFAGGAAVGGILGGSQIAGRSLANQLVLPGGDLITQQTADEVRSAAIENPLPSTMKSSAEEAQSRQAGSPVYQSDMRPRLPKVETAETPSAQADTPQDFPTKARPTRGEGVQIPVESRTWEDASNRKVNAFQFDHPELHPYYAQAAQALRAELSSGTRGERYPLLDQDGYVTGYTGTKRAQASPIEQALDNANLSYNDIDRALTAIIQDQGQENYASAKKMELVLDDMLANGYTNADGREVGPNESYVAAREAINSGIPVDSTEYRMSQEEWDSLQRSEPEARLEPFRMVLPGGTDTYSPMAEDTQRAVPAGGAVDVYDIYGSGSENLPEIAVGANKANPWELFQASSKEFFPAGANAARDVDVPTTDPQGRRIRKTAATAMGAKAIPDEAVADIQNMVLRGELSYNRVSDKSSINRAVKTIQDKGYQGALEEFRSSVGKGVVSKDIATLGQQLLINAANAGDGKTTAEILSLYAQMETTAGQAVQAASILRKLAPSDQLYAAKRMVSELEKTIQKNYKDLKITIDQNLIEEFNSQTTQEGRDQVLDKIYQNVANQIPATWKEKWNAWRYLAMLGNPRTHIRNVDGNLFFQPLRIVKDRTAAAIEAGVSLASGGRLQRTKSFAANPALYKAAWQDFENVRGILSGNLTDDIRSEINSRRTIYNKGLPTKALEALTGRTFKRGILESARTGNSWLLESEDTIFKRITYTDALAGYLQANGVTAEQMRTNTVDANLMSRARDYAGQEALRATYQDRNVVSDKVVQVANVLGPAGEAILPFKRTPANILVRGLEYSPAGLAKALTADLIQVKRGNMTGAEAIDHIAAGLTGSALFALGAYLFSKGIVTSGGGDDENQDRINELTGSQNYALNLPGGGNVTLDWLAPEALPFFMGVELADSMGQSGNTTDSIMTALKSISDPMLEMSMLQSLNDVIESVSFSENKLGALASSAVVSYFTQAIPTIGGQLERTMEDKRMTTYTDKALTIDLPGPLPEVGVPTDVQYAVGRASARLPGLDYQQIPFIDAWGREESSGPLVLRAANNFLNPSYTSSLNVTPVDAEIQRIYDQTGDGGVVPERPNRFITVDGERVDLSADQYVQYATERGKMQFEMLESLLGNQAYHDLTDSEKASAISDVYKYADAVAKSSISDYQPDSWISEALESDIPAETFILFRATTSALKSDKDANGNTISGSKKTKVLNAINSMDISSDEKDAMYYAAGYASSGNRDAPWH